MTDETQTLLRLIGQKTRMQIVSGFYRGRDELRATVDFTDGRVPAYFTTGYLPEVNEPVWILVAEGAAYLLGPTVPKPAEGTMMTSSGGIAQVMTDMGQVSAVYRQGDTLNAGDLLMLDWAGGCRIVGVKSTNPADPDVPPVPGGGGGLQTRTFTAIDSGAYETSWWQNDVWCSVKNHGGWFYGSTIRDTIPDSAAIKAAAIFLPQTKNLGSAPFGRHDSPTKPSGPLTFHATAELPARDGWVPIPTSLIDHLKANPGGLGFAGGGYSKWAGTQKDAQSGAVRVTYQT